MTTPTKDTIIRLLEEGKSSAEIIGMGYKAGTVYEAQRKWRQSKTKARPADDNTKATHNSSNAAKTSVAPVTDWIENDPEIVALKKEIRKAELESELGRVQIPSDVMSLEAVAREIGEWNLEFCPHNEDGLCTEWEWCTEEGIPNGIGKPICEGEGIYQIYRIKPSVLFCAMCPMPLYHAFKRLEGQV